ncbi:hypothetical protein SPAN111604_13105 [Sphingomonas antarctica]|uniref:nuclear transport factor 2 family protein n=1 Tax=Sphingomonas antarctica TaxID=2040274 RepID=UPI0039EBB4F0
MQVDADFGVYRAAEGRLRLRGRSLACDLLPAFKLVIVTADHEQVGLRAFIVGVAAVITLVGLQAPAHASQEVCRKSQDVAVDIDAASQAFDDAQFHGNVSLLERFLARDLVYIRGSGRPADRRAFIANFTDSSQRLNPFVISDRRVISLGRDAALISADGVISGTAAGKPFREHFRFADTFVRRCGRWVVVYVQVTPVAS